MFMFSNDMTSDILIYNILNNCTDEFINKCNLKFPDHSVPASEDDTIYVANVDLETLRYTFNSEEYKALVEIYVRTKDTDYLEASRFLRTVAKHIKSVLRADLECKKRGIRFRNITYEYSKYTLKGLHLLVQLTEYETLTELDDAESCVSLEDVEVDVK